MINSTYYDEYENIAIDLKVLMKDSDIINSLETKNFDDEFHTVFCSWSTHYRTQGNISSRLDFHAFLKHFWMLMLMFRWWQRGIHLSKYYTVPHVPNPGTRDHTPRQPAGQNMVSTHNVPFLIRQNYRLNAEHSTRFQALNHWTVKSILWIWELGF